MTNPQHTSITLALLTLLRAKNFLWKSGLGCGIFNWLDIYQLFDRELQSETLHIFNIRFCEFQGTWARTKRTQKQLTRNEMRYIIIFVAPF